MAVTEWAGFLLEARMMMMMTILQTNPEMCLKTFKSESESELLCN